LPAEEWVQSAEIADDLFAGTERKMIGIAQYHFGTGLLELSNFDSFDSAERSDGHKRGQFDRAVCRMQSSPPGLAVSVLMNECVHGNLKCFDSDYYNAIKRE
jgi:hypothetical protein